MRNNKKLFKNVAKTTLALGVALTVSLNVVQSAQAAQALATLSGVEINGNKDSGYEVLLNTDKNVEFKKYVDSKNRIVIDLKGTSAAKNLNTIYNKTTGIDHVMFKPVSKDNVKIYLQGKNVAYSDVALSTGVFSKSTLYKAPAEDVLVLNKPITSYKPVTRVEEEVVETTESYNETYSKILSTLAPGKLFDKANLGWLVSFGMFIIFLIGAVRGIREKNKVNIKITEDLKQKEIDLYSQINRKRGLIGDELGLNRKKETFTSNLSKRAYGMKAYENSQKNPMNLNAKRSNVQPDIKLQSQINPMNNNDLLNKPGVMRKRQPSGLKTQSRVNTPNNKDVEIDSVKFLESMAKIYEKSGRVDLANGLQGNILRAKTTR